MSINRLTEQLAENNAVSKGQAKQQIRQVFQAMEETLDKQGRVGIPDFGSFTIRHRKERIVNGPLTKNFTLPAHNAVVFKPFTHLKEKMR